MRYPALEYQPGIAAEQLSPLAPPREPRHPKPTPNAHTGRRHSTRPLTTRPPYQPAGIASKDCEPAQLMNVMVLVKTSYLESENDIPSVPATRPGCCVEPVTL